MLITKKNKPIYVIPSLDVISIKKYISLVIISIYFCNFLAKEDPGKDLIFVLFPRALPKRIVIVVALFKFKPIPAK